MDFRNIKTKRGGVVSIHKKGTTGNYITNLFHDKWEELGLSISSKLKEIVAMSSTNMEEAERMALALKKSVLEGSVYDGSSRLTAEEHVSEEHTSEEQETVVETVVEEPKSSNEELKLTFCKKITQFFSEFTFKPAARFLNTLYFKVKEDHKSATSYVSNYMKLIDSPDTNNVIEKMKSIEWKEILGILEQIETENKINNKLEIYFGPQGTGKTTDANKKYPDAAIVVCNSSMLPDDLMQDFDFNDENGNPQFKKSALRLAMEGGMSIILDEMNLLPLETLRFMQGLTDNKKFINYKGDKIELKDGFKIIGTMNLVVNGQVFGLTEPIVDRCSNIEEYDLTAKQLSEISF